MMKRFLLFLVFIIIAFNNLKAQVEFTDKSRAVYILDISKYISWPETGDPFNFRVGILDSDTTLFNRMTELAAERDTLHGKKIRVQRFDREEDVKDVDLIFFKKSSGFDIDKVFEMIGGKPVLMITEGYPYHMSMINFIVLNGRKRYEVNKNKIEAAGLKAVDLFVVSGVKSKADWANLYEKSLIELAKEKRIVTSQKKQIEKQKQEIERQLAMIKQQDLKIKRQLEHLKQLSVEIAGKQAELERSYRILDAQKRRMKLQKAKLDSQRVVLARQQQKMKEQIATLEKQKADIAEGRKRIESQRAKINQQLAKIEQQQLVLYISLIFILLLAGLGYFIYRSYKIKKQANIALEEKNRRIAEQNVEITKQRDIAREQRDLIAAQKKHITDSIVYAKRIQRAILPNLELFKDILENFFILFKPRDIVSGDFYWENKIGDEIIIIAADCTGHGVPGAFMSMLGVTFLNDIIVGEGITDPGTVLDKLRTKIIESLKQRFDNPLRDGMDIAVINLNYKTGKIRFAGANNPLFLIRNGELAEIKGDKMPVALHEQMLEFESRELELSKDDKLYIFSDGFVDQFGGPKGKKFMKKRFKETLLKIYELPMQRQREELNRVFEEWKGENEQLDDVLVIGIKI